MTRNPNPAVARRGSSKGRSAPRRELLLKMDDFAWETLEEEALGMGVSAEELANFAVLYYLADHDSGRTARQVPGQAADGRRTLTQLRTR